MTSPTWPEWDGYDTHLIPPAEETMHYIMPGTPCPCRPTILLIRRAGVPHGQQFTHQPLTDGK